MDNQIAGQVPALSTSTQTDQGTRQAQATKLYQTAWILVYGKRKSVERAIKCVQRAITFDDTNYKYWQLLGEAYYQRGSLNSAINCFIKSLRLATQTDHDDDQAAVKQADSVYSRLRMSDIRLSVGHLDDAYTGYYEISKLDSNNVPALLGLTKTKLQLARNNYSSNLVKSGHAHLMEALKYSLRAIKLCPHLCITWKLASDCCLIQFVHGRKDQFATVIEERFPDDTSDYPTIDRATCLQLAQQFLCKALAIEPFQQSSCLWHNLAISLYFKGRLETQDSKRALLLTRSLKCLLRALKYERDNSHIKSSIGVVAFNLNLLNAAQSFMIKSIRNNLSTSEIQFSNLGFMFLQKGEFRLASVAFSRCQAEEPLYSRSWLGKALIEDQNNLSNLPLLRHCHRLENNYQSLLLYATKVVSLPQADEYKKDFVNALDCMQRVINYNCRSIEALNTLGLLYERCNQLDQARDCFDLAYSLNNQDSRVILNRLRLVSSQKGKTCWSLENSDGAAIDQSFIQAAEKLGNSNNREYILNYIYYLFTSGDTRSLDNRITKLIDKLDQRDIPSKACAQILLGLASKIEGGDFKSWFFKNIIDLDLNKAVCVESLINNYCLMLMAVLHQDGELVDRISDQVPSTIQNYMVVSSKSFPLLESFYTCRGYWLRLTLISSIFCNRKPRTVLTRLLVLYPMIAELWLYFGITFLLRKSEHPEAITCLQRALLLSSKCAEINFVCNILMSILVQTNTRRKISTLERREKYLSRAIYRYPQYGLLWKALFAALENDKPTTTSSTDSLSKEDFELFALAIRHLVTMIKT